MATEHPSSTVDAKRTLRTELLAARRAMSQGEQTQVAEAIAWHLLAERLLLGARRVAAYRSMPGEPGTGPLLATLTQRGVQVLVPVVDGSALDWVLHDADAPTVRSTVGVDEPTGPRLGRDALKDVDVVLVPALAVDHAGQRLGRGAGYYDRALRGADAPFVALTHARELLPQVPSEPHDVPVAMVATEAGIFRVPPA